MSTAQPPSLLTNRDLDRLARLRLNATRRFTNRARGEHLAAKGGTSTEFCDYRDYSPGDDVRFVDLSVSPLAVALLLLAGLRRGKF